MVHIEPPADMSITFVALSPDGKTLAYGLASLPVVAQKDRKPQPRGLVFAKPEVGRNWSNLEGQIIRGRATVAFLQTAK